MVGRKTHFEVEAQKLYAPHDLCHTVYHVNAADGEKLSCSSDIY